jgi:AAA domain
MHFDNALRQVAGYIDDNVPGQLISLIGESKTGKTTLLRAIHHHQRWVAEKRGRRIGVVRIELGVSQNGQFDVYDLYYKALEQMGAVLIHQKVPYPPLEAGALSKRDLASKGKRRGLEHAFRSATQCEKFILIIDEGNTEVGTLSANGLRRFAETLKYIANEYQITVLIAGCPELVTLTSQTDQLIARRAQVLLPAYGVSQKERQAVCDFLGELEKTVGGRCAIGTLYNHTDEVISLAFGRVGLIINSTARVLGNTNRGRSDKFEWTEWSAIAKICHDDLMSSAYVSSTKYCGKHEAYERGVDECNEGSRGSKRSRVTRRKPKNELLHPHGQ